MPFSTQVFVCNVRMMRAKLHITQEELARRTGLTQTTVAKYEDGSVAPGVDKVWALATEFGCDPNDLIGWEEK